MSDWVIDNSQDAESQKISNPSDWEIDNSSELKSESYGQSLKAAPGRIFSDISDKVIGGIKAIPDYYQKAKTELPGLINPMGEMAQHPLHARLQNLAGISEAINSLSQAPLDIAKYGANRLNLLPQSVPNTLQKVLPEDRSNSINQIFGQPKYAGEAAMRGAFRNAPELLAASKLASITKPSQLFTTKKSIKNDVLNTHDQLENRATDAFKEVSDKVNERGITQIPLNEGSSPKIDFNEMRGYFPNTKQYNSLLEKSSTGDYNALRKLQTNLYEKGKKNLGSDFEADRNRGSEMLEKRNEINQIISDHLVNTGNNDLANTLQGARNDWRTLQQTYYNPNMNNALIKMVDKQHRKIPNNLVKILSEDSIPMQNLRDFHPGLETKLNRYQTGQNILKKGTAIGLPAAAAYIDYEFGKPKGH